MPAGRMSECFRQPRCVLRASGTPDANLIGHPHFDLLRRCIDKCWQSALTTRTRPAYELLDMGHHSLKDSDSIIKGLFMSMD